MEWNEEIHDPAPNSKITSCRFASRGQDNAKCFFLIDDSLIKPFS